MATIRQRGPGKWHVQVRKRGVRTQTRTFRTKKDAQIWATSIENEIYLGQFRDQRPNRGVTFGTLIQHYIREVTDHRPSKESRVSERLRLERFLKSERDLCAYYVRNLTPEHFNDYKERRLKEPSPRKSRNTIAAGTVKRELTTLKRVIDYKRRELGIQINPVNTEDVKRPAVNDERDVRLTVEQMNRLLEECYAARNEYLGPFVELALETGARRGNLLRLKWDDVDLDKRTILFRAIKNSRSPEEIKDHLTGLSPRAIDILNALPKDDGRVLPVSSDAVRKAFERARERAEVPHFTFHDIRHERISNLIESDWSIIKVMAVTGHKDVKSLRRYANMQPEYMADELAKLDKSNSAK
jgi:integrase